MNGYNPEAVGAPRENEYDPVLRHDVGVIREALDGFFGPESRYPSHNDAMLDSLREDELDSPGMITAVEVHDLVDHGLVNPRDEQTYAKALQLFNTMYGRVEDKHRFIYGTLCAFSASMFEQDVAESWRVERLDQFSERDPSEVAQIRAAITKDKSAEIDEKVLKTAHIRGLVDTTSLRDGLNSQDVEGLPLNSAQLIHNLLNRPKDNPASTYRDCEEILYAYAPALVLAGFKKQGARLRGEALKYFYDDPEIVQKAKKQLEKSERNFGEVEKLFSEALAESLEAIAKELSLIHI